MYYNTGNYNLINSSKFILLLQSEYKLTVRGICIPRGLRTLFVQGPREEKNHLFLLNKPNFY